MSELRRLVDDPDSSALEVSLLTAARMDAPSAESRRACAAALGLAAAGTTATAGAASAKAAVGAGAAWKWLGVLVLVGAVAGGLLYQSQRGGEAMDAPLATPITAVASETPTPPTPAQDPVAPPAIAELPPEPAIDEPVDPPVVRTRRTEPAATNPPANPPEDEPPIIAAPPEPPVATPAPTSRLAEEVALLDTARDALSAGDLRAASAALATHQVEFQEGLLVPESEILRIEVQLRRGQGPAAVALATRFLERFPNNALAKRARTLLERAMRL